MTCIRKALQNSGIFCRFAASIFPQSHDCPTKPTWVFLEKPATVPEKQCWCFHDASTHRTSQTQTAWWSNVPRDSKTEWQPSQNPCLQSSAANSYKTCTLNPTSIIQYQTQVCVCVNCKQWCLNVDRVCFIACLTTKLVGCHVTCGDVQYLTSYHFLMMSSPILSMNYLHIIKK